MLPHFVVIGAMKAGTTSLWHYLRAHPRVYMPRIKELRYFQKGGALSRGLAWYEAQFAAAEPGQLAGEASPGYTKYPHQTGVPERMAAVIPDARLVYVVRDP